MSTHLPAQQRLQSGLLFLVALIPVLAHGQYKLSGVVRDSTGRVTVPGANISIEIQQRSTTTNQAGEFEIESRTPSADVTFSFIGYQTIVRTMTAGHYVVIDMPNDPGLESNSHFKTFGTVGYVADPAYAPFGVILTHHIQSVGKTNIGLTSIVKYWQGGLNHGFEGSVNKELSGRVAGVIDNVYLGYKEIDYPDEVFGLKQTRIVMSHYIEQYLFSVDAGAGYNEVYATNEQGIITQNYVSGSIGLTKMLSRLGSAALGLGLQASVDYHPDRTMFEAAAFKSFFGRRFPYTVLMAKYYSYHQLDGWMLSLRLNIFSSECYCCYSYRAHAPDIAAVR